MGRWIWGVRKGGGGAEGPVPLVAVLGSVLEAPTPFLPSWPCPVGVRTSQLSYVPQHFPGPGASHPAHALPAGAGSYDGGEVAGVIRAATLLGCPVTILSSVPQLPSPPPPGLSLLPHGILCCRLRSHSSPHLTVLGRGGRRLMRSEPAGGGARAVNLGLGS